MSKDYYSVANMIDQFGNKTKSEQEVCLSEIKDYFLTVTEDTYYSIRLFDKLFKSSIDKDNIFDFLKIVFSNNIRRYQTSYVIRLINSAIEKYGNCIELKNIIINHKNIHVKKYALNFSLTEKEETNIIKLFSQSKKVPSFVYEILYRPSKIAVASLPPVTRLKVLGALSGNINLTYNIFSNLGDEDNFRSLIFSSSLRHNYEAEQIMQRYQTFSKLGSPAKMMLSGTCGTCGKYSLTFDSGIIRNANGLSHSAMKNMRSRCPICGRIADNNITFEG